ncbi:MAG: EAL domain-containing protein, partial [Bacillota bacterium]|nr:EAL domain-containing protein [Bacillota bacterium]
PVMDGYTFLSEVKSNSEFSSIPIIVTTQNDNESDEVTALARGATDFVAKPYKPQIILHRVASIINLRENAAMMNLFKYDRLTGVYSKEFFMERVREMLLRNPKKQYDLICSDVENFKLINDVFGMPYGDALLKHIADVYKDKVEGMGICGRMNADQFVCFVERRAEYPTELFTSVNAEVNKFLDVTNVVIKWGVYQIEDASISVEQMCDRVLLAARSIRGRYGEYVAIYDDTLRDKLLKEQAITDSMESALEEGQFVVYMQPKYRIKDECLVGAEALIRWEHPEWGLQSPGEFIPIFERNGFITKLDQFVWDKVCSVLRDWDDKGLPTISVSVNVSRADIYNTDIAQILMSTVNKYGLSPSRLHLEITESAYAKDPKKIIDNVSHLKELGFIIEMDDFGSGYSSLNMLNEMSIDVLKLDMKFIQNETTRSNSQGILQFIINLARWMHLSVVAEGVETKEQLRRLEHIGCDYVQGYYFAKPMAYEEFEKLLRSEDCCSINEINMRGGNASEDKPLLLIADEDMAYRQEISKVLEEEFEILETSNCKDTLDCIKNRNLSVLILSLTLPEPDGFLVLEEIQKDNNLWNFPVITTCCADMERELKAFEMGADDFVSKPHLAVSLLKRIQHINSISAGQKWAQMLANHDHEDHLTGLLNRRGLEASMAPPKKEDFPLGICVFDLDDMKKYNDTYGYSRGDQLLVSFSNIILKHTDEEDLLARVEGNKFLIIFTKKASEEKVLETGRKICSDFRNRVVKEDVPVSCFGGAAIMKQGDSIVGMVSHAEYALRQARAQKLNDCCLWKENGI